MNAWIYRAALLCDECAEERCLSLCREAESLGIVPFEPGEDSEYYPQGPYGNGGGESDSPAHCDECMVFLENPLTTYGMEYVREQVSESLKSMWPSLSVAVSIWAPLYGIELP